MPDRTGEALAKLQAKHGRTERGVQHAPRIERRPGAERLPGARSDLRPDPFGVRAEHAAPEAKERSRIAMEAEAAPGSPRRKLLLIGGLFALVLGVAAVGMPLREGDSGRSADSGAAAPATEMVPAAHDNACTARLGVIMDAVTAYAAAYGEPPETLAALHPEFLPSPPVDPDSKRPYGYRAAGDTIALSCPAPEQTSDAR